MKKIFVYLLAALTISLFAISSSFAAPVIGGQVYSLGGEIVVEVLPASAGYTSELHLYSPASQYIATNREIGKVVNLGSFPFGNELIFGIYVQNTGNTFLMGPGTRNPDNIPHAAVEFIAPGQAIVGFEDLWGGGDRDYNDNMFLFRGSVAPIPEPATMFLLGSGLIGLIGYKKRK
ncbi:MAG: PEP-CTERM sorting domain-containing protein [Candidatus Schekmanbacteria bacterium]|nr:PEP-CTERM sorting domain-containing protein [Candidatus Schekmanbacteria bacterium]